MSSLLTVREAAVQLRLSRNHLYELAARGEIPHLRISPRRILFDIAELRAFMEQRAQQVVKVRKAADKKAVEERKAAAQ